MPLELAGNTVVRGLPLELAGRLWRVRKTGNVGLHRGNADSETAVELELGEEDVGRETDLMFSVRLHYADRLGPRFGTVSLEVQYADRQRGWRPSASHELQRTEAT